MSRVHLAVLVYCAALVGTAAAASAQQTAPAAAPMVMSPSGGTTGPVYRVTADVVTSGVGPPGVQGVGCVNQTVFFPGDRIVWRAVVADGQSGQPLTQAQIEARGVHVVVTTSDGTKLEMHLHPHPPPPNAPAHSLYWSVSTGIPATHPTGTLKWTVAVSDKDGHGVTFAPIGQDAGITVLTIAAKGAAAPR